MSVYDDMRAALDSALAENARAERRALEAEDLLCRCLEVINEKAEKVLASDVRRFLGLS
ncbi:MAG TPA: hypothetical protein VFZ61_33020 [Polyangiales bacterium]